MSRQLMATICILGLVGMIVGVAAKAVNEATVAATVTVQNISVTVTDGTVAYGVVVAGESKDTLTPADHQTATNNGNVTETLNIRGTNSAAWTLADTASGATNYKHEFSKTGSFPGTALTLINQTLASGVAKDGSQVFDLKITTPPSAADFTQQSVNVIVQATL